MNSEYEEGLCWKGEAKQQQEQKVETDQKLLLARE
jgi:hypothetical protein